MKKVCFMVLGIFMCLLLINVPTASAKSESDAVNIYKDILSADKLATYFDTCTGDPVYSFESDENKSAVELTGGSLYSKNTISSRSFTISASIKAVSSDISFAVSLGNTQDISKATDVSFIWTNNKIDIKSNSPDFLKQVPYSSWATWTVKSLSYDYTDWFKTGEWYDITLVAKDTELYVYINGKYMTSVTNSQGYDGAFILKNLNQAPVRIKNLNVYETTMMVSESGKGKYSFLDTPVRFLPGCKQEFTYVPPVGETPATATVTVADKNTVYETILVKPTDGKYTFSFIPRGSAGYQTITITDNTSNVFEFPIYLHAETVVDTGDKAFNKLFNTSATQIKNYFESKVRNFQNIKFKCTVPWIRDNTWILEGSKYWESADLMKGWVDFFLNNQTEEGFYLEKIGNLPASGTIPYIDQDCYKILEDGKTVLERLELEADVEYLMVQAVYQVWKATGDDEWMMNSLAKLDKGLMYIQSTSTRWDSNLGLAIRVNTTDTWDFPYGTKTGASRRINPWGNADPRYDATPMAVFHGDNTGYYQASWMIAEMYKKSGNNDRANYWNSVGETVKKNLINVAWNGNYFAHMVHTAPTSDNCPEEWKNDFKNDWSRLSLSNAFVLNRNMLDQEHGSKIIESFIRMRDNLPKQEIVGGLSDNPLAAEWVTIYPSYTGGYYRGVPGRTANGLLASFTAGELARGSFVYGYPEYGADIINRLKNLCARDGEIFFMYGQNGQPSIYVGDNGAVGPAGWSTAAIYGAIVEGLAGFKDLGNQFKNAELSPAWTATDYNSVYSSVSYGASDNYIAYTAEHDKTNRKIKYTVVGDSTEVKLDLLVPAGNFPDTVTINGQAVDFDLKVLNGSNYATLTFNRNSNLEIDNVEVSYSEGVLKTELRY